MSNNDVVLNGRYRLMQQQGSGGMAVIYKAQDLSLGRIVAVKILRPTLTNDPAFLARFRQEARSVANFTHPNIVTIHDFGNDGPTYYIIMEFVEGQDLKKIIKAEGVLSLNRVLNLAVQICDGIGLAHRAGWVHADIKPQNILVNQDELVKVTDFGIAQALTNAQSGEKVSVVWGSPHYFAPEQARGERPTTSSDVYSIGIVLFEMLTGRLPYTGSNQQELALAHIRDTVPMVTDINPNVPKALATLVYKMMSKEPSARYRMADQVGQILRSFKERGFENTSGPAIQPRPPVSPVMPTTRNAPSVAPSSSGNTGSMPPSTTGTPPPSTLGGTPYAVPGTSYSSPSPVSPTSSGVPPGASYPMPPTFKPSDQPPTQRYDLAPNAPNYPQPTYPTPTFQQPASGVSGNTNPYYSQYSQPYQPRPEAPPALDLVTVGLGILALFAVMCLIPLYIVVFQARFGG
ncbi:MAG: protein kinase [Chloroflexota bacterium]|nr:protein kinase [Chloroflexota bacterium]